MFYFFPMNRPRYPVSTTTPPSRRNRFDHRAAYGSQCKCYDGMHNWNQLQPAVYDGMYSFPSVTSRDATGKPTGTNCLSTVCVLEP